MSSSFINLDKITKLEQIPPSHWFALGQKMGGVKEVIEVLKGQKKLMVLDEESVIQALYKNWQDYCCQYFNLEVDFSGVSIPQDPGDHDWLAFNPASISINRLIEAFRKKGVEVSLYVNDLDKDVRDVVKRPAGNYAFRVRQRVEADEENKNLSANQLKERGINCITLKERLILEWDYFSRTGKHLDVRNGTYCAGSRYSDGDVPGVRWSHTYDKVRVRYCHPDYSFDGMRARSVVS